MRAAFYKGTRPGLPGLYNRLGRWLDGKGKYSHTELVLPSKISCSSSWMDGGVRMKYIGYTSGDWDFLELPAEWAPEVHKWYHRHDREGYDLVAQIKFAFGFAQIEDPEKWFCTESNLAALGSVLRVTPHNYGPNKMYELLQSRRDCFEVATPWNDYQPIPAGSMHA